MPKVAKPAKSLSTDQVSTSQKQIAELLNPELEVTRKLAIAKSPKVNVSEQIDIRNLPEHLLIEVSNAGLTQELERMPKCLLTFSKKKPLVKQLCRFISRYGKVQPHF